MLRQGLLLHEIVKSCNKPQAPVVGHPIPQSEIDARADHPRVLRGVALAGGYSTDEASAKLAQNHKMIASFSRALTEGLRREMDDDRFVAALGKNIKQIYDASVA